MTGLRKYAQNYMFLLKIINECSIPEAARQLSVAEGKEVTETAVRNRLHYGRALTIDAQWFLNNLYNLQKGSQRIRKFSIDGRLKKKHVEEEWENE